MIKFYTNQELSNAFDINLARWKRWSREFLPPDPLGGLQSGYARQYNADQAFTVYLGGFLVGDLRFTIPEARTILRDLGDWLAEHRFYFNYTRDEQPAGENSHEIEYYQIVIIRVAGAQDADPGFSYVARGVISDGLRQTSGIPVRQKRFVESTMNDESKAAPIKTAASYRVLNISVLHNRFLTSLDNPGVVV
jgi:hypothetical protein